MGISYTHKSTRFIIFPPEVAKIDLENNFPLVEPAIRFYIKGSKPSNRQNYANIGQKLKVKCMVKNNIGYQPLIRITKNKERYWVSDYKTFLYLKKNIIQLCHISNSLTKSKLAILHRRKILKLPGLEYWTQAITETIFVMTPFFRVDGTFVQNLTP